jgi:hypothetical protein
MMFFRRKDLSSSDSQPLTSEERKSQGKLAIEKGDLHTALAIFKELAELLHDRSVQFGETAGALCEDLKLHPWSTPKNAKMFEDDFHRDNAMKQVRKLVYEHERSLREFQARIQFGRVE